MIQIKPIMRAQKIGIAVIKAIADLFVKDLDYLAAALTFYTLISVVPLMIIITTIMSFLPFESMKLLDPIYIFIPDKMHYVDALLSLLAKKRTIYGGISFIVAYYAATGLFRILYKALVMVFEVPFGEHKKNLKVQFFSIPFFMMVLFGIYVCMSGISTILKYISTVKLLELFDITIFFPVFINIANVINFLTIYVFLFLIYHTLAPRKNKKQANTASISILISLIFISFRKIFAIIAIYITKLNVVYGMFGGFVGFLAWLFFSFNLILIGARAIYYLEQDQLIDNARPFKKVAKPKNRKLK